MALGIGAVLAASLITGLLSSVTSYISSASNMKAQQYINEQNVNAQKEINQQNIEYSKEFAQNGISWKMQDLQNAGLNPVLAAGMSGNNSQPTAMSAPVQKAPMMDLSGISSAIMAMNNMMMSSYLISQRNSIASEGVGVSSERNEVLRERNAVLDKLYRRKAESLETKNHAPHILSAKQMSRARKELEEQMTPEENAEWDRIMKELSKYKRK